MGIIEQFNVKESVCETAYEEIRPECHLPTGTRPNMLPSMKEVDAVFQSLKQADGCKRTNDLSLSSFSPQLSLLSWCHLVMVPIDRSVIHYLPTVQVQVELQVLGYWDNVIIIHDSVARNGKSDMDGCKMSTNIIPVVYFHVHQYMALNFFSSQPLPRR